LVCPTLVFPFRCRAILSVLYRFSSLPQLQRSGQLGKHRD
jgi:hypothetical protein